MSQKQAIPIIVGVGEFINRSTHLEDALEPMELMLRALQRAVEDTSLSPVAAEEFQSQIDSIDVVSTWTWPYSDLPGLLSHRLGVQPRHKLYSEYHGGNQPGKMLDNAARRISNGGAKVALVTGGEALASLGAFAAAKKMPPPGWTNIKSSVDSVFKPDLQRMANTMGAAHKVGLPIQVYPFYENAYRVRHGQSIKENMQESAKLYGEFAKVAEQLPTAWHYGRPAETEQSIGTVTKRNRMICFPYPLLMNAFNTINLAGACLLTSTDYAEQLGIPVERWIYPLGGAVWLRPTFDSSPSITQSLDAGLEASGLKSEQIDVFDFYSCFPIVPKLACEHLGLSPVHPSKPITLLGGLTSFGGAGNNYSMHAVIEMTRYLRRSHGKRMNGLVLANGGTITYQHAVCLSSLPRADGQPYPQSPPLPEASRDVTIPDIVNDVGRGQNAIVETYTVDFKRDNTPLLGHIVGRLDDGRRFIANHADVSTLQQLASTIKEPIGRKGWVKRDEDGERNLFSFETRAGL